MSTFAHPFPSLCLLIAALIATDTFAQGRGDGRQPTPAPRPSAQNGSASVSPPATARAQRWNEQEYRLGPGDKLRVEVYREPQLSQSLQVRPDGKITLPLAGDIAASGRTALELRDALSATLKEYITNPVVTVIVVEALAAQVFVIGEVASPGAQVMQGPVTVLQALAQAGGLKEFASSGNIRILRRGGAGVQETIPFNYKDAIRGRLDPVYLEPGDTVVVP